MKENRIKEVKETTTNAANTIKSVVSLVDRLKDGKVSVNDAVAAVDTLKDVAEFLDGGVDEIMDDVEKSVNKANGVVTAVGTNIRRNPKKTIAVAVVGVGAVIGHFFGVDVLGLLSMFAG